MNKLITIIAILLIFAIAVFTGTWIFNGFAFVFEMIAKGFRLLSKAFDFFGWSGGIV